MSNLSAQKIWISAIVVLVIAVAAVGVLVGVSHLSSQNAVRKPATALSTPRSTSAQAERVRASMSALPLGFEANQGQTDPQVKYMARGNGYTVFLTANDAVFALHSSAPSPAGREKALAPSARMSVRQAEKPVTAAIAMKLVGGNAAPQISAGAALPGRTNYFIGNDPSKWQRDVKQYETVSYREVYPGVDMKFHGQQRQLEFDFNVAPGADVRPIQFNVSGAKQIKTDAQGNLVLASSAGNVMLHKPVAYQEKDNARQPIDARFTVAANHTIGFELGSYDHSRELVIDPSIAYSTYLGGSAEDDAYGIAIDSGGNAYITGQTASTDFPVTAGSYQTANGGGFDAFVTKISASGSTLVYSTFIGGSASDSGNSIAVNAAGNAFVAGGTGSSNFPTTAGAFQTSLGGALDAFVLELNGSGSGLVYSTLLGGSSDDYSSGIALDSSSNAYVVGATYSSDFPTKNPLQANISGASNGFVTKLNSTGTALTYSTYLGGGTGDFASAVAVDSSGNAYVTGATPNSTFPTTAGVFQSTCGTDGTCNGGLPDAFVSVLNASGGAFVYSTFLGGESIDEGVGITVDANGDAFVTGLTGSMHYPTQSPYQSALAGSQNAFVTELKPNGTGLLYSTYLGGSQSDAGTSIALDGSGNIYVTGQTSSSNFPTASATQTALGGDNDAFVSELSASGSQLLFSTYLGGSLNENTNASGANLSVLGSIAVNNGGTGIYVAGNTASANFPTASAEQSASGGGTDAFVAKYKAVQDFLISATTPSAVSPGSSGSSTITLTSLLSYNLPVNLTCSVTGTGSPLPACSASSFSTNPVTPTSAGATSTLTITTTGAAAAMHRSSGIFYAMWLPVVGLSLIGMRFSTANTRRRKLLGFLLLGIVMAALFFLPACGGSSSSGGGGGGCSGCTPAGSYTVTITGTDANSLTHSAQVTLTVN